MKTEFLTLMVTTQCTLRCAQCALSIPYIRNEHYKLESIVLSIKKVFQLYDYVGEFMISGGEAILHPEIVEIIEECSKFSEQYKTLKFYTNATVLPEEEILLCLKKHCVIRIDDYGVRSKAQEWINLCEKYGCPYEARDYRGDMARQWQGGWLDILGDLSERGYTDQQKKNIFRECQNRTNCRFIWAGRLWACGCSAGAILSEKIPDFEKDSVDLLSDDFNAEEIRGRIGWNDLNYLESCSYCNGFLSKKGRRIPAAVQIGE